MKVNVNVNAKAIEKKLDKVIHDETLMFQVHTAFKKYCNDYVPARTTTMAQSVEIDTKAKPESESGVYTLKDRVKVTKDYVHYIQPYAHYQYVGEVYGPNFPLFDEDGDIKGWRSPKGKGSKHPTGRALQYSTQVHPKASKEWDKAMMADKGEQFMKELRGLIKWRAKQLYG